ncbi:type IV secretory system conjugative DNA transfer family protein [[Mycoplasma] anseris]|uniref:Type IV secretory system conjugative DNA transfer family protein n=1 Tax=[Mycoplasma] anseris TaxID=92400 RepID=A0A2Z4NCX1_9BACT|nr:type IV secretory system conjugative DNA transfer family protein [[Mycoplasma] anseris]AWX69412.1 hypothetical protein DP065_01420 [[Mycoplasma] anseris]
MKNRENHLNNSGWKTFKIFCFVLGFNLISILVIGIICFFWKHYSKLNSIISQNQFWNFLGNTFQECWWIILIALIIIDIIFAFIFIALPKLKTRFNKANHDKNDVWLYNQVKNIGDKNIFVQKYLVKNPFSNKNKGEPGWVISATNNKAYVLRQNQTLILGGSGSGKTQKVIIPSIYYNMCLKDEIKPHMVVSDLKGELSAIFTKPLSNKGYNVLVLDLINPRNSMGWAMLGTIWDLTFQDPNHINFNFSFKQIDLLIRSLKEWNLSSENNFWDFGAIQLLYSGLAFMLLYGYYYPNEFTKEDFTFNNLLVFLEIQNFQNGNWFNKIFYRKDLVSDAFIIRDIVVGYRNSPTKQLSGQIGIAVQAIIPFIQDKELNDVINTSEIEFINLFKENKPFAIFLKVPENDESRHVIIFNFIQSLYMAATSFAEKNELGKLERQLLFLLDEFGNIPAISSMQTKLSVARGRGIFFACVLQSINQLEIKYEKSSKTIKDVFNSWIFLGGINNRETLNEISQLIGKEKYTKTSTTTSVNNSSETSSTQEREAIGIAELQKLPKDEIIVLQKQEKSLWLKIKFAYQYLKYDVKAGLSYLSNHIKPKIIKTFDFYMEKEAETSADETENKEKQKTNPTNLMKINRNKEKKLWNFYNKHSEQIFGDLGDSEFKALVEKSKLEELPLLEKIKLNKYFLKLNDAYEKANKKKEQDQFERELEDIYTTYLKEATENEDTKLLKSEDVEDSNLDVNT